LIDLANVVELSGTYSPDEVAIAGGCIEDGKTYVPVSYICQYAASTDYAVLIGEMTRPGVLLFSIRLENELFTPYTEKNQHLMIGAYVWTEHMNMPHVVLVIPSDSFFKAQKIANECDIRFAPYVTPDPVSFPGPPFPITGRTAFRLENLPTSKVYEIATQTELGSVEFADRMADMLMVERQKAEDYLKAVGARPEVVDDSGN
jgi:hypothetical protein